MLLSAIRLASNVLRTTMLILQTNKLNIVGRIIALLIIVALLYLIIKKGIIEGRVNHEKGIGILYFTVPLLTFVFTVIVSSFFQVLKVRVDIVSGEIIFTKLFSTLVISKQDIIGYYTTIYKGSRAKPWRGLLLKTVDSKSIKLTQQNLKSIHELKELLEQQNLKYLGEKPLLFSSTI